jgi:hypothetical protein
VEVDSIIITLEDFSMHSRFMVQDMHNKEDLITILIEIITTDLVDFYKFLF